MMATARDQIAHTLGSLFMEAQELRASLSEAHAENAALKTENQELRTKLPETPPEPDTPGE